jgi:hypothetical protein
MSDPNVELEKALSELKLFQSMIDNIEYHLKGLRTQCAPNDEYTQKEIRVTEVYTFYNLYFKPSQYDCRNDYA